GASRAGGPTASQDLPARAPSPTRPGAPAAQRPGRSHAGARTASRPARPLQLRESAVIVRAARQPEGCKLPLGKKGPRMRRLVFTILVAALVFGGAAYADKLDDIIARGNLVCGVNDQLPGFGTINAQGEFEGFDVDFCRAIAAAILGDANAVQFRALSAQERFTAVQTGEVDVLIRNTTWTSSRDTSVGLEFAPTTFYDGQGFMARRDSGITTLQDLEGRRICVQSGTTTELNLNDVLGALNISFEPVIYENADQLTAAYDQGACDAWTTDKSGLASRLITLQNPADHVILDATISKEPLGPAVLNGEQRLFDVVKWVVFALFT